MSVVCLRIAIWSAYSCEVGVTLFERLVRFAFRALHRCGI